MAYRNKTYVCFDADTDIRDYNLMKAWKENDNIAFNFHNAHDLTNIMPWSSEESIKRSLKTRMENSRVLVVLIGRSTKNLHRYVRWEIELAQEKNLPIIAVNLNKKKSLDRDYCPPIIRDSLAMHIAYGQKIIDYALNNWPQQHNDEKRKGTIAPFFYEMPTYRNLYPNTTDPIYNITNYLPLVSSRY